MVFWAQVLEMLEQGKTPPGIREDIVDVPPNPLAPPPDARLKPRSKPWERSTPAAAHGKFPSRKIHCCCGNLPQEFCRGAC